MIEQLFGSKTRVKLLYLFYCNPNRSFYVREITRKVDEQINSVRRELGNLLNIGIIKSDTSDNKLFYEVNQQYEFYSPLRQIFGKKSTKQNNIDTVSSAPDPLQEGLAKIGRTELAILTGQFTRDNQIGIDILLVGDFNQTKLGKFIAELEESENKELLYAILTKDEFLYRVNINDRFITSMKLAKKQVVVDKLGFFEENKTKG